MSGKANAPPQNLNSLPAVELTLNHRSVVGYMPFVGYVTIMLSEHPWLKTVMLGLMGLVVVLQRE